jgi:hypothetical protein
MPTNQFVQSELLHMSRQLDDADKLDQLNESIDDLCDSLAEGQHTFTVAELKTLLSVIENDNVNAVKKLALLAGATSNLLPSMQADDTKQSAKEVIEKATEFLGPLYVNDKSREYLLAIAKTALPHEDKFPDNKFFTVVAEKSCAAMGFTVPDDIAEITEDDVEARIYKPISDYEQLLQKELGSKSSGFFKKLQTVQKAIKLDPATGVTAGLAAKQEKESAIDDLTSDLQSHLDNHERIDRDAMVRIVAKTFIEHPVALKRAFLSNNEQSRMHRLVQVVLDGGQQGQPHPGL